MNVSLNALRAGAAGLLFVSVFALAGQGGGHVRQESYIGFDRNEYPGDASLAALRKTFAFTGYWLNPPPGAQESTWAGKRETLREAGFGFLVLFNGRLDADLKKAASAADLGRNDAAAAVEAVLREGFPANTTIFLDQEEGGRMLPEQKAYIYAWVDGLNAAGFRAGVYCSGIAAPAGEAGLTTAEDIRQNAGDRSLVYWVANDACPPSPGCAVPRRSLFAMNSGTPFADVWQYAQSPRRRDMSGGCPKNYAKDGNCYPPGLQEKKLFVDLDVAAERDPSHGR